MGSDLPLHDLLPHLLAPFVHHPHQLALLALVSSQFAQVARPLLYRSLRFYHSSHLHSISLLFRDLAAEYDSDSGSNSVEGRGRWIRNLEVRVFPLSAQIAERVEMDRRSVALLKQATALERVVWTRLGSLSDGILTQLALLPSLTSFEFNAHSADIWSPRLLLSIVQLRSLSIILPDRGVAAIVVDWLAQLLVVDEDDDDDEAAEDGLGVTDRRAARRGGRGLDKLSILCRESPVINTSILTSLVARLSPLVADPRRPLQLSSLSLAGCTRITAASLLALLDLLPNLKNLALESCLLPPSFFRDLAPREVAKGLRELKLTYARGRKTGEEEAKEFYEAVGEVVRSAKEGLNKFTLYSSGNNHAATSMSVHEGGEEESTRRDWPIVPNWFVKHLVENTGERLTSFVCSGVLLEGTGLEGVEILAGTEGLKELVVHFGYAKMDWDRLSVSLSRITCLESLHMLSQRNDGIDHVDDILKIAIDASRTLHQIGFRNKVWSIKRVPRLDPASTAVGGDDDNDDDGRVAVKTSLEKYDHPFWPEALLVVRT